MCFGVEKRTQLLNFIKIKSLKCSTKSVFSTKSTLGVCFRNWSFSQTLHVTHSLKVTKPNSRLPRSLLLKWRRLGHYCWTMAQLTRTKGRFASVLRIAGRNAENKHQLHYEVSARKKIALYLVVTILLAFFIIINCICVLKAKHQLHLVDIHATADLFGFVFIFAYSILPTSALAHFAINRFKSPATSLPTIMIIRTVSSTLSLIYTMLCTLHQACTDLSPLQSFRKRWKLFVCLGKKVLLFSNRLSALTQSGESCLELIHE